MFALVLVPVLLLFSADNRDFMARVGDGQWDYVGPQVAPPGARPTARWR